MNKIWILALILLCPGIVLAQTDVPTTIACPDSGYCSWDTSKGIAAFLLPRTGGGVHASCPPKELPQVQWVNAL